MFNNDDTNNLTTQLPHYIVKRCEIRITMSKVIFQDYPPLRLAVIFTLSKLHVYKAF